MQPLLTQRQCAALLCLSERTLERFRVSGIGPKFVRMGKSVRYRLETDPWEELLSGWLANMEANSRDGISGTYTRAIGERDILEWRISSNFLLSTVLSIPQERQNNNHTKRLAWIMRGLGWTRYEATMRIGKTVCRGFVKPIDAKPVTSSVTPLVPLEAPKLQSWMAGRRKNSRKMM